MKKTKCSQEIAQQFIHLKNDIKMLDIPNLTKKKLLYKLERSLSGYARINE